MTAAANRLTLYVRAGADHNTNLRLEPDNPFPTIEQAVDYALTLLGHEGKLTLELGPGTYPEPVVTHRLTAHQIKLTVDGDPNDHPRLSGWERLTGWKRDTRRDPVYITDYPFVDPGFELPAWDPTDARVANWLYDRNPSNVLRAEHLYTWDQIVVSGERYRPAASRDSLAPGRYYIDRDEKTIRIQLRQNFTPDTQTILASARKYGLRAFKLPGLNVKNLVVDGFGYNIHLANIDGLDLENVTAMDAGQEGIHFYRCHDTMLTNCATFDNGINGFQPHECRSLRAFRLVSSGNNWRGYQIGATGFIPAGMKATALLNPFFKDCRWIAELGNGAWLDTGTVGAIFRDCLFYGNQNSGLVVEVSLTTLVERGIIGANGKGYGTWAHSSDATYSGLALLAAHQLVLVDTSFYNNEPHEIWVGGGEERTYPDWQNHDYEKRIPIRHYDHMIKPASVVHNGNDAVFFIEPWLRQRYLDEVLTGSSHTALARFLKENA